MIRQLDSSGEWELRQLFAHTSGRVGHSDGNPIVGLIRPQTGMGRHGSPLRHENIAEYERGPGSSPVLG